MDLDPFEKKLDNNKKILVIGFDGIDYNLLHNWIYEGKLPNFRKVVENGVFGPLKSTIPPLTPPAWTSIATGKNPGKHGIFDFIKMEWSNGRWKQSLYSSVDKKAKELWDYIENSIVVNLPVSYPPKKIKNGIVLSGMLTPDIHSEFVFPPEIKKIILRKFPNYRFELDWNQYEGKLNEFISDLYEMTEERIRLFWYFFNRDWNLMFFVFIGPDRLQHIFWEEREMIRYYRYLDIFIGEVIEKINSKEDNIDLMIVSDHGFERVDKIIYVNKFLESRGLLKLKFSRGFNIFKRFGLTKEDLTRILIKLNLVRFYKRFPEKIVYVIRQIVPGSNPAFDFDLESSIAFMSGFGGIYLNKKLCTNAIREKIISELSNWKDTETGKNVIQKVFRKEEIYNGEFVDNAPDLVILPAKGYSVSREVGTNLINKTVFKKADHALYGIFIAYGPDIKEGDQLECIEVYDIAPTILHMFGLPVPKDMDGRVLVEIFKDSSEILKRKVIYMDKLTEEEKLKDKIKKLKQDGKLF